MIRKKCPECDSTNLVLDTGAHRGKYKCNDCGYFGAFVIEEDE